jgi:hypothetical protein
MRPRLLVGFAFLLLIALIVGGAVLSRVAWEVAPVTVVHCELRRTRGLDYFKLELGDGSRVLLNSQDLPLSSCPEAGTVLEKRRWTARWSVRAVTR